MDAFASLAQEFDLVIIEDAAQANRRRLGRAASGSLGVAAAFSFYPTKNLKRLRGRRHRHTTRPEMAEHMRRLRNHG